MCQRSHIKLPDTISVNRLTTCCEEVSHGDYRDIIMPGIFKFGQFLFSKAQEGGNGG